MTESSTSVHLSASAAERVQEFMRADGGVGLRLGVRKTGCSGWAYEVGLAESVAENDHVFEDHGVKILVDDQALPFLSGTTVDFVQQGLNYTFEFDNPNVKDACGCGESVTFG
ncbi:MAG: iron-sulfur cluster assembly accessory protein [Pseudomonadota bacterium]